MSASKGEVVGSEIFCQEEKGGNLFFGMAIKNAKQFRTQESNLLRRLLLFSLIFGAWLLGPSDYGLIASADAQGAAKYAPKIQPIKFGEYPKNAEDLKVKVTGGYARFTRTWTKKNIGAGAARNLGWQWDFNRRWNRHIQCATATAVSCSVKASSGVR